MTHVVAWMTSAEEGIKPYQLHRMLGFLAQESELSGMVEISANNSTAHAIFDLCALEDLSIDFEAAKAEVIACLTPVLEDWSNESPDCFYTTVGHLRIFMGCDQATYHGDGLYTAVVPDVKEPIHTYRALRDRLNCLTDDQLDCGLQKHEEDNDEFFPIEMQLKESPEDDVLDKGHPFISYSYRNDGENNG
jgi:hypothetical protein